MNENERSEIIIECCIKIHKILGLLINFNKELLKAGVKIIINGII